MRADAAALWRSRASATIRRAGCELPDTNRHSDSDSLDLSSTPHFSSAEASLRGNASASNRRRMQRRRFIVCQRRRQGPLRAR